MDEKDTKKKKAPKLAAPKTVQIKVTPKESERILNEIFENNYAVIEFDLIPGKTKATLRNLSASDQIQVENYMSTIEGSAAFVLHTYTVQVLAYTLLKYGDKEFTNTAEIEKFLADKPSIVLDKLIKIQNAFEQQIKAVLQFEKINDHFLEIP